MSSFWRTISQRVGARDTIAADNVHAVPDFHFSKFLRHVVDKARERRDFPTVTRPTTPRGAPALSEPTLPLANTNDPSPADADDWLDILARANMYIAGANESLSFMPTGM